VNAPTWPMPPLDLRTSLATALLASPGVYALLLASGVSRSTSAKAGRAAALLHRATQMGRRGISRPLAQLLVGETAGSDGALVGTNDQHALFEVTVAGCSDDAVGEDVQGGC
jgi:hypothetical protein